MLCQNVCQQLVHPFLLIFVLPFPSRPSRPSKIFRSHLPTVSHNVLDNFSFRNARYYSAKLWFVEFRSLYIVGSPFCKVLPGLLLRVDELHLVFFLYLCFSALSFSPLRLLYALQIRDSRLASTCIVVIARSVPENYAYLSASRIRTLLRRPSLSPAKNDKDICRVPVVEFPLVFSFQNTVHSG